MTFSQKEKLAAAECIWLCWCTEGNNALGMSYNIVHVILYNALCTPILFLILCWCEQTGCYLRPDHYLNTSFYTQRIYGYNKSVLLDLAAWNVGLSPSLAPRAVVFCAEKHTHMQMHRPANSNMRTRRRCRRRDLHIRTAAREWGGNLSDPLSLLCAPEPLNGGNYLQSSAVRCASERGSS